MGLMEVLPVLSDCLQFVSSLNFRFVSGALWAAEWLFVRKREISETIGEGLPFRFKRLKIMRKF